MIEETVELERDRRVLAERLHAQRGEFEREIVVVVRERVPAPIADENPELAVGLPAAVAAIVEYSLQAIETGVAPDGPLPGPAVQQARRLARAGVTLNIVLLRYVAGSELLEDLLVAEIEALELSDSRCARLRTAVIDTQRALRRYVLERIGYEHETATASRGQRRAELVYALLAGSPVSSDALGYDLAGYHLGAIATGACAEDALREAARGLGRDLLLVSSGHDIVWGWMGAMRPTAREELTELCAGEGFAGVAMAFGEPVPGPDGFRLTHRMAQATQPLLAGAGANMARFSDAPLVALAVGDQPLARWLIDTYLRPLDADADGAVLRKTLRAYLAAGCNTASTAPALDLGRSTVRRRLARIESLLGAAITHRSAELSTALALEDLLASR